MSVSKFVVYGFGAFIGLAALGVAYNVITAPGKVISKTMDADNIIHNYEWFHNANGQFKTHVANIRSYVQLLSDEKVPAERTRINIELMGMKQGCRSLAEQYNSRSTMSNRDLFKGKEAPVSLNAELCG